MDMKLNRRSMVKGLLGAAALPVAVRTTSLFAAGAGSDVVTDDKLAKADDPVVKALKYVADGAKAPERKDAKSGVAAKDQTCFNCALFTKSGKMKDGGEVGKCTMIQSGLVKSGGWCTSWSKKA